MIPSKHHVVFATPCFSGTVAFEFHISTLHTAAALAKAGMNAGYIARIGDAYLSKVRNKLVTQFLYEYPNAECLFFLDDDISWPAHKVIEFINRPEDVVAGIYPKKMDDLDWPVMLEFDADTGQPLIKNGLWRAIGVPTGFLRIKRHVLEKMAASSGVFKDGETHGVENYHNIFEMGMGAEGWWWGEDYAFCDKWRKMGGEIWVDPDINFTHRGMKKWENNLSDHLDVFRAKALIHSQERAAEKAKETAGGPIILNPAELLGNIKEFRELSDRDIQDRISDLTAEGDQLTKIDGTTDAITGHVNYGINVEKTEAAE